MELPWTVYGTFVLEQKHGFNNQVRCHTRQYLTSTKALAEEAPTAACLPMQTDTSICVIMRWRLLTIVWNGPGYFAVSK